jgi:hypothetical protein
MKISLKHKFVKNIPDNLEEGVVYISLIYGTVVHKCCCGCGKEVITPLSSTDWKLIFDGESVSLYPSIGNWNFDCKSHYWIRNDKVVWCRRWSKDEINAGRHEDYLQKKRYFNKVNKRGWFYFFKTKCRFRNLGGVGKEKTLETFPIFISVPWGQISK